jgi:hypothetical protein
MTQQKSHMMIRSMVAAGVACLSLVACSDVGAEMKLYLFSPVTGRVIHNGVPVAGAKIERTYNWVWKNETRSDSTTTDGAGQFQLPAITRLSLWGSLVPHDPYVEQRIDILANNVKYTAFQAIRRNYEVNYELDGAPMKLVCRLEQPATVKERFGGICDIEK